MRFCLSSARQHLSSQMPDLRQQTPDLSLPEGLGGSRGEGS